MCAYMCMCGYACPCKCVQKVFSSFFFSFFVINFFPFVFLSFSDHWQRTIFQLCPKPAERRLTSLQQSHSGGGAPRLAPGHTFVHASVVRFGCRDGEGRLPVLKQFLLDPRPVGQQLLVPVPHSGVGGRSLQRAVHGDRVPSLKRQVLKALAEHWDRPRCCGEYGNQGS